MSGRTCLVTGAGRGLGRDIALHLAGPDTRLFLHAHRSAAGVRATATAAEQKGSAVVLLSADLADLAARERMMDEVQAQTDRLDVLVNNAGIYPETALAELTPAEWQTVLDVTCSAVFHLTQRAAPLLRAAGTARVVNIGDSGADRVLARPLATPYHVAKLGVNVLTRSFARLLGGDGVTVNMISPGFLDDSVGDPGSAIPAGRLGAPADILAALDFLLSADAAYTNGANLVVSGGWNV